MYRIEYAIDLEKILKKIPKKDLLAIRHKIHELAKDPRGEGSLKLHDREGAYRVRVGNYRILYCIQDKQLLILIIDVDHRKSIYKTR